MTDINKSCNTCFSRNVSFAIGDLMYTHTHQSHVLYVDLIKYMLDHNGCQDELGMVADSFTKKRKKRLDFRHHIFRD